jgi:hypothetical protein
MNRVIEKMICLTKQFENRGFLQGEIYDIETITDRKKIVLKTTIPSTYIARDNNFLFIRVSDLRERQIKSVLDD